MVFYVESSNSVGATIVLLSVLVANTIEYAEWKTGQRREGLITST
jgi:Na+/melibiose symporter-like transporter